LPYAFPAELRELILAQTSQMTNHCLSIGPSPRELAEQYASRLEVLGDAPLISLSIFECDQAGLSWQVDAHYASAEEAAKAAAFAVAFGVAPGAIRLMPLEPIDWVKQSLQGLSPVRAGRFFIHGSHDRGAAPPNLVALEIDAGIAFGTGHHGTTRGCLLALDRLLRTTAPKNILDVGCGSGILAIAAAKAAHRAIIACDIDHEAVQLTARNARINGTRVIPVTAYSTRHPAIQRGAPYDLVMANILARPLAGMASSLAHIAAKGAHLILSGLLADQRRWIEGTYRHWGFAPRLQLELDGWSTLVMRRE
jgi:ribosomal protein L11 methyltransferase